MEKTKELKLFDFIDETVKLYEIKKPAYLYAEKVLCSFYEELIQASREQTITIYSRVKSPDSLKEKLLRKKYYLDYKTPQEALHHMPDLVGLTIECRFIRNEADIYKTLSSYFHDVKDDYSKSNENPDISLNLHMAQPQLMRNGYAIYRIDGQYQFNGELITYELQIKSLVHSFWSEIEHEVIYKNQELVADDRFFTSMMGSLRDSLDVVDHQMELLTSEITRQSEETPIGMDEKSFKLLAASSINELANRNMRKSVGFATDFRKESSILGQYIYIRYFINGSNNEVRMAEFLEHLNYLRSSQIDYRSTIQMESGFTSNDPFEMRIGQYWLTVINTDFEWHAFFVTLFSIQDSAKIETFSDFANVIGRLLIQPGWYELLFSNCRKETSERICRHMKLALADGMIKLKTVDMLHEDHLYAIMHYFRSTCEAYEKKYPDETQLLKREDEMAESITHGITMLFH